MGTTVKCENCKKNTRYSSDEINAEGTLWDRIWTVKCPNCGEKIIVRKDKFEFTKDIIINEKENGSYYEIYKAKVKKNGYERAIESDILEYWIQKYIQENFIDIGFSKLEGPFEIGPDFSGVYKGRKVWIEVERKCHSYIEHKHHENERFADVNILIVLSPDKPIEKYKKLLPKKIIYLNIDNFVKWWEKAASEYASEKIIQGIVGIIASEFQGRFVQNCSERNRELVTCPECDLCAYFEEFGVGVANNYFKLIAIDFIDHYNYQIFDGESSISNINYKQIDNFYIQKIDLLNHPLKTKFHP